MRNCENANNNKPQKHGKIDEMATERITNTLE